MRKADSFSAANINKKHKLSLIKQAIIEFTPTGMSESKDRKLKIRICDLCMTDRELVGWKAPFEHWQMQHSNDIDSFGRSFCYVCAKSFSRKVDWRDHFRKFHTRIEVDSGPWSRKRKESAEKLDDCAVVGEKRRNPILAAALGQPQPEVKKIAVENTCTLPCTCLILTHLKNEGEKRAACAKNRSKLVEKICPICPFNTFKKQTLFLRHLEEIHNLKLDFGQTSTARASSYNAIHRCDVCLAEFRTPRMLFRHLSTSATASVCQLCDLRFRHAEHLEKHKMHHHTALNCSSCRKQFRNFAAVRAHRKKFHKDDVEEVVVDPDVESFLSLCDPGALEGGEFVEESSVLKSEDVAVHSL